MKIYLGKDDAQGNPKSKRVIPEDVTHYVTELVKLETDKAIANYVKNSGLPENVQERQELFGFLKLLKKMFGWLVTLVGASMVAALLNLFEVTLK